jgi:hypothetical protein
LAGKSQQRIGFSVKQIFYILVVINLVFLVWKFGLQERDALIEEANDQHVEIFQPQVAGLENESYDSADFLSGEPDPAETDDNAEAPAALPKHASNYGCFEIGPIQEREKADYYLSLLTPNASEAHVVIRSGDIADGWWVIYPKASTREAALANRQMLLNNGITETWLFDKGPLEGSISLGLYPTQAEAQVAHQGLMEKGITTKLAPRLVRGDVFWLKIPWSKLPLVLDDLVQMLNSQDPTLKMPPPEVCR